MSTYRVIVDRDFSGAICGYRLTGIDSAIHRHGDFYDDEACRRDAHQELAARDVHIPLEQIGFDADPILT